MTRRYWTGDEIERLRALASERVRVSVIAHTMGRTIDSIRSHARRFGVPLLVTHPQRRRRSATRWQRFHEGHTPPRISLARVSLQNLDADDAPEARPRSVGAAAFDYDGMIALQMAFAPRLIGRVA